MASLNSNAFVRHAARTQASSLAGQASGKILQALYGGLAEALYRNNGVFGDDSEALRLATEAAFKALEDDVSKSFASLYGQSISRAMLNGQSPSTRGELNKEFRAANQAYRAVSDALMTRANRRQRAWLKRSGYQTKRAYLTRTPGRPGLHPQGQSNFGVQSGRFAREFLSVEEGGSLRSGVFVGDAEEGKKSVLVRQTIDASRGFSREAFLNSAAVSKPQAKRTLKSGLSSQLKSGVDLTLSAQTQLPRMRDVASNVQYARLRRNPGLPYNNQRLAEAALAEAIRRA